MEIHRGQSPRSKLLHSQLLNKSLQTMTLMFSLHVFCELAVGSSQLFQRHQHQIIMAEQQQQQRSSSQTTSNSSLQAVQSQQYAPNLRQGPVPTLPQQFITNALFQYQQQQQQLPQVFVKQLLV